MLWLKKINLIFVFWVFFLTAFDVQAVLHAWENYQYCASGTYIHTGYTVVQVRRVKGDSVTPVEHTEIRRVYIPSNYKPSIQPSELHGTAKSYDLKNVEPDSRRDSSRLSISSQDSTNSSPSSLKLLGKLMNLLRKHGGLTSDAGEGLKTVCRQEFPSISRWSEFSDVVVQFIHKEFIFEDGEKNGETEELIALNKAGENDWVRIISDGQQSDQLFHPNSYMNALVELLAWLDKEAESRKYNEEQKAGLSDRPRSMVFKSEQPRLDVSDSPTLSDQLRSHLRQLESTINLQRRLMKNGEPLFGTYCRFGIKVLYYEESNQLGFQFDEEGVSTLLYPASIDEVFSIVNPSNTEHGAVLQSMMNEEALDMMNEEALAMMNEEALDEQAVNQTEPDVQFAIDDEGEEGEVGEVGEVGEEDGNLIINTDHPEISGLTIQAAMEYLIENPEEARGEVKRYLATTEVTRYLRKNKAVLQRLLESIETGTEWGRSKQQQRSRQGSQINSPTSSEPSIIELTEDGIDRQIPEENLSAPLNTGAANPPHHAVIEDDLSDYEHVNRGGWRRALPQNSQGAGVSNLPTANAAEDDDYQDMNFLQFQWKLVNDQFTTDQLKGIAGNPNIARWKEREIDKYLQEQAPKLSATAKHHPAQGYKPQASLRVMATHRGFRSVSSDKESEEGNAQPGSTSMDNMTTTELLEIENPTSEVLVERQRRSSYINGIANEANYDNEKLIGLLTKGRLPFWQLRAIEEELKRRVPLENVSVKRRPPQDDDDDDDSASGMGSSGATASSGSVSVTVYKRKAGSSQTESSGSTGSQGKKAHSFAFYNASVLVQENYSNKKHNFHPLSKSYGILSAFDEKANITQPRYLQASKLFLQSLAQFGNIISQ